MTKEQFLKGTQFYVGSKKYKGDSTYSFSSVGSISRQSRSSIDNRIVLEDYECNVTKIGRVGFVGFTFVMGKKVVVRSRFEDLVEFKEEA
jgi:hypothetical protein